MHAGKHINQNISKNIEGICLLPEEDMATSQRTSIDDECNKNCAIMCQINTPHEVSQITVLLTPSM